MTGYTYNISVNLVKSGQNTTETIMTHARVKSHTKRVEGVGHYLYMDNFFSSPDLFDDQDTIYINCCELSDRIIKECHGTLTIRH
jgi:hypothetical protein